MSCCWLLFSSHCCFRCVTQYCEDHPEAAAAVETELELSKEMVELLPFKINRLKLAMVANNWRMPQTGLMVDFKCMKKHDEDLGENLRLTAFLLG